MTGVWLEDLTWPEAKAWFGRGAPVIVPIGAASKEHGHHLPMKTDWLYARELARRVAAELPVVVAPVVGFGYYPAFVRYPGSQSLSAETFGALLREILAKFIRDGVRSLAVVNTGVSTEPVLRIVVRDLYEATGVRVHTADARMLGAAMRGRLQQKHGGHGDESETSVILAIDPRAVRMDLARPDYGQTEAPTVFYTPTIFDGDPTTGVDHSQTGVRGDPTLATAGKGEAILAAMAGELIAGLRILFPKELGPTGGSSAPTPG
jgi:creatinine amidohydrolase